MARPPDPELIDARELAKRLGMTESQLAEAKRSGQPLPRPAFETPTKCAYRASLVDRWEESQEAAK